VIGQGRQIRRGIDRADEIKVLRRARESRKTKPADGQENAPWRIAERTHRAVEIGDFAPLVAYLPLPGLAREGQQRNAKPCAGRSGMARHLFRKRMRRVDHALNPLALQICAKPVDAAKAADAHRDRLRLRLACPAGKRKHGADVRQLGNACGKRAGFARAAEDQHAHATNSDIIE